MNVLPGLDRRLGVELGVAVAKLNLLHRDDAVATGRHDRSGHDFDAGVAIGQCQRRIARRLNSLDMQRARTAAHHATVDRNAIHGYTVEGRLVALGVDIFAKYRARALHERQGLYRQTLQLLSDQRVSLGGPEHRGINSSCWRLRLPTSV